MQAYQIQVLYIMAMQCLSEGYGDVAFAKDSTVGSYCGNENASLNEDWCLPMDDYVPLPAFGQAPSHPVMYNPEKLDVQTRTAILERNASHEQRNVCRRLRNARSNIYWMLQCNYTPNRQ